MVQESEERKPARQDSDKRQDELTLRQIRKTIGRTQKQVASAAGIDQAEVSRLEQQAERAQITTLRRYVRALGGELVLMARFPSDQTIPIRLRGSGRSDGADVLQDREPARRDRRRGERRSRRGSVEPSDTLNEP